MHATLVCKVVQNGALLPGNGRRVHFKTDRGRDMPSDITPDKADYPEIPVNWNDLAGFAAPCLCGRTHAIDTQRFVIDVGAIQSVAGCARELVDGRVAGLVSDKNTFRIAGDRVQRLLQQAGYRVTLCVVPDAEGGRPHATFEAVQAVERQLESVDFIAAVGSGTINDLGKLASYRLKIPYLVVATAPSMNGYTSAIAAIMKDGLKCTMDCHQPVAVIADLDVLSQAPMHLIQAGLGDLESKPVSTADFLLSSLLRGTYYCPVPGRVVAVAEQRAQASAHRLPQRDPAAIRVLTEALLLSGCSMKLAGSSSPASGGEHLISHLWDMTAPAESRVEGFHGAQVGVATIVSASLYEYLQSLSPDDICVDRLVETRPSAQAEMALVVKHHGSLGQVAAAEFRQKRLDDAAYRAELTYIKENWSRIWDALTMLKPASEIRNTLASAGCPLTMDALALTEAHLRHSFLYAREIRGRFTVLDMAADLGVLDDALEWVLVHSGCISQTRKDV
ncbi:MAG: sn-glycerol-1-phosphate dehydrogenase [Deltaproteobacteria bacterium]|nr:sn-glycerol-1-phosphate dehydrogenase [Deltaproteobacteria bacterium]